MDMHQTSSGLGGSRVNRLSAIGHWGPGLRVSVSCVPYHRHLGTDRHSL